jgi:hypothetical protein
MSWTGSMPRSTRALEISMTCNLTATACEGDGALHQSKRRDRCHDKEASLGKYRCRVKMHLADRDAQLEEAFIIA